MNEETGIEGAVSRRTGRTLVAMACFLTIALSGVSLRAESASSTDDSTETTRSTASLPEPTLTPPDRVPAEVRIALGPTMAVRSMTFEGDGQTIEHHPQPYRGAALSADFRLVEFDDPDLSLTLEGDLTYGIARNRTLNPRGGPKPRTQLVTGGARLMVYRSITTHLGLGLGLGLQSTSATIEPNRTYTGHRYRSVDATVRLRWYLDESVSLALESAVYPVLATDNSNGAHGPSTSFGVRGGLDVAWAPFVHARRPAHRGWRLVGGYRYQRFRSQFPVSPIGIRGGISLDQQHRATLSIGYVIR